MSEEESKTAPENGKDETMEVDHKDEVKTDKGGGGDHESSEDEHDTSADHKEENDKDVKDEKASESPAKRKTPKKPKKVEAKDQDSSAEEDDEDKVALLERPAVVSGKRERKKVDRIEMTSSSTPKEKKLEIPEGKGTPLGEIPNVEFRFQKTLADDLKPLHRLVYGRNGTAIEVKRNLRKFCGFGFKKDSTEYTRKVAVLTKLTMTQIKSVCEILEVERGGQKEVVVTRLMDFLMKPSSSGKALLADKKKRKSGKGKKTATKKKGKKDEKGKKKKTKKTTSKDSDIEDSDSDDEEEEEEKEDESDADDSESEPKKKTKAPAAKKKPAKKRKKEESDEDDDDEEEEEEEEDKSEDDEPPKKKAKPAPVKEQKKEEKEKKKVESPKKKNDDGSDSESDDDEPLVKPKSPKPPTNDELKDVIKGILDGANLEEVTMKSVCKQVYAKYEQFDLTSRKDFIKSTVREIIQ